MALPALALSSIRGDALSGEHARSLSREYRQWIMRAGHECQILAGDAKRLEYRCLAWRPRFAETGQWRVHLRMLTHVRNPRAWIHRDSERLFGHKGFSVASSVESVDQPPADLLDLGPFLLCGIPQMVRSSGLRTLFGGDCVNPSTRIRLIASKSARAKSGQVAHFIARGKMSARENWPRNVQFIDRDLRVPSYRYTEDRIGYSFGATISAISSPAKK